MKLEELAGKRNVCIKGILVCGSNVRCNADEIMIVCCAMYDSDKRYCYVNYYDGVNISYQMMLNKSCEVTLVEPTKEFKRSYEEALIKQMHKYLFVPVTIGADPEIFVEASGQIIPAFNFLGSKASPNKYSNRNGENANNIYWDGFQAEFDTSPQTCLEYHTDVIQNGLKQLSSLAKSHNPDAKLSSKTVMDIPIPLLESASNEHVAFGCVPSLNVYGMEGVKLDGRMVPFRSAGGHIHFGFQKNDLRTHEEIIRMIKAMDAILGVCCVSLFKSFDDSRRRIMYGLAGEYRLPSYGFEYRVLSNAWLVHPLIKHLVFDLARKAAAFGSLDMMHLWNATEKETIEVINSCDVIGAQEIMKRNSTVLKDIFGAAYRTTDKNEIDTLTSIWFGGIESVISTPHDIENNWQMKNIWSGGCYNLKTKWATSKELVMANNKLNAI